MSLLAASANSRSLLCLLRQHGYAIPLRLIVGFGFMQHGYAKLARGPEDFINVLHVIGVPAAYLLGWATIIVEIIGGFLLLQQNLVILSRHCTPILDFKL